MALLDCSATINTGSKNLLTPLHMSVQGDHVDSASLLLARGAHIDAGTRVRVLHCVFVSAGCMTYLLNAGNLFAVAMALWQFALLRATSLENGYFHLTFMETEWGREEMS